jgi:hypothetical protein
MNCKQGDIAEIVKLPYANCDTPRIDLIGTRIICTEYIYMLGQDAWVAERVIAGCKWVSDALLKPINPEGEQDEMLRIAGLPQQKEKEHVKL